MMHMYNTMHNNANTHNNAHAHNNTQHTSSNVMQHAESLIYEGFQLLLLTQHKGDPGAHTLYVCV